MEVREHDLPGVGKKFAIVTDEGDRMTVIIHNTGSREIYHFREGEEYPFFAVRLTDAEARKMGAVLGGAYFQPPAAERMDLILEHLSIEWLKVEAGAPIAGHTIGEAAIRKRTGASVIAILRDGEARPNPGPDERLEVDDTLVVIGDRDQVARFRGECAAAAPR